LALLTFNCIGRENAKCWTASLGFKGRSWRYLQNERNSWSESSGKK
jgi:hypothetical protein